MRYVLSCGHFKSLHAIAYLYSSAEMGIAPSAVIVVRLLSFSRLRSASKVWGPKALRKKVVELFFPSKDEGQNEHDYIKRWIEDRGYHSPRDVRRVCQELHIPVLSCPSLNSASVINFLNSGNFDLAVYLGGGLLRRDFINAVRGKILNAHQGPLPEIRGMNAIEWSIFTGLQPKVTVHCIDTGIDTGEILFDQTVQLKKGMKVSDVRGVSVVLSVEMLLKAVDLYRKGKLAFRPQELIKGDQYFTMHPYLFDLLEDRLRALIDKCSLQ